MKRLYLPPGLAAIILVVLLAQGFVCGRALAYERTIELDDGQAVVLGSGQKGPRTALVLLPYTGGASVDIYRAYRRSLLAYSRNHPMVVLLPEGDTDADDYEDHEEWMETIADWEETTTAVINESVSRGLVNRKRIFLAGHSMGGDLSWALLLRHPDRYAGAVINGSRCSYLWGRYRKGTRLPPVFLSMGDRDSKSRQFGMRYALRQLALHGVRSTFRQFHGGHHRAPDGLFLEGLAFVENPAPSHAGKAPGHPSSRPAPPR